MSERAVEGLVDTGAVSLVIPEQIVQELGLRILGRQREKYADGREAPVDVTGPLMIECLGRQTVDQALVTGDEVLKTFLDALLQTFLDTLSFDFLINHRLLHKLPP